ncbi:MAG: SDR family oxidoreductase [Candidatus Eisenbacteria bacterium]|uniref:SDR family oxidoreductase n=1 Tax=Eiseniibacteriota bacterium TaxID=2212470 RepID=A0A538SNP6_UNCEI|nr:MAG: SDR family oxidoreductase [Candidatus Eisenbacteria bacterium]
MRVVVTGGAGMLGSHLCEELLACGHTVYCVDNLITGRLENIEPLQEHPRFTFIKHDVVNELPPFPKLDRVYHLASPASPPGYARAPIETLRVNSEGTRRLLELTHIHKARFLYASTSEIYGDPLQHPQTEEYRGNVDSIGPRSVYDEAKRYGEAVTMAFVHTGGLDARVVRIFNTYGPHCDPNDGRLVANMVTQALRGEPMTIYGDGSHTRSLCYVSDMVAGLIRAMELRRARGEVINLGNPEEHTVLEFAELIRDLVGSRSRFVFTDPPVGDDPHVRCPDIHKAQTLLGWKPFVSLEEGLTRTIDWLRHALELPAVATAPVPYLNGSAAPVSHVNGSVAPMPYLNGSATRLRSRPPAGAVRTRYHA